MKKAKTAIYIPNMDADTFEKICQEKGMQFVYVEVPEHGRLIDADVLFEEIGMDGRFGVLEAMCIQSIIYGAPTIIPADKEKET